MRQKTDYDPYNWLIIIIIKEIKSYNLSSKSLSFLRWKDCLANCRILFFSADGLNMTLTLFVIFSIMQRLSNGP